METAVENDKCQQRSERQQRADEKGVAVIVVHDVEEAAHGRREENADD